MTDYIDREALIESLKDWYCVKPKCNSYHGIKCRACYIADAIANIEDAPAVDVTPVVHAKWIMKDVSGEIKAVCTHCGKPNKQYQPPYCPHCGAKMDEEDKNNGTHQ